MIADIFNGLMSLPNLVALFALIGVVAAETKKYFDLAYHDEYKLNVHFTRGGWNGRMKACRGIGASLPPEKIKEWERAYRYAFPPCARGI